MKIMEIYALQYEQNPLVLLQSFDFTFGCQFTHLENVTDANDIYGRIGDGEGRQHHHHNRQLHHHNHRNHQNLVYGGNNNNGDPDGSGDSSLLIGTGGKVLETLQSLMAQLIGLKHLSLRNLLLNPYEGQYLLDNVLINCCERLQSLKLINCTIRPYAWLHTGCFINLQTLVISNSVRI